jgi:hypothetical protein
MQASTQSDERKGKGGEYMFLYLVQHGEAKREEECGVDAAGDHEIKRNRKMR